ncbi:MAG TPA: hypothetical protein VGF86_09395 [Candidatus Tumulicola sp.]|jgi:hypothetical protein
MENQATCAIEPRVFFALKDEIDRGAIRIKLDDKTETETES